MVIVSFGVWVMSIGVWMGMLRIMNRIALSLHLMSQTVTPYQDPSYAVPQFGCTTQHDELLT